MGRKKLNLGYSDFKGMIEGNYYYVDKSMFIDEIINSESAVMLIPRPRRFGKTLNLSMLRYFFSNEDKENKKLFHELKIWQTADEIKQHCCKYPVIYLTFKDVKGDDWESTRNLLYNEIIREYTIHDYLLTSNCLKESELQFYKEIINKQGDLSNYENSLIRLSVFLNRYYHQKVVILIDEYDTPIHAGYKKFYTEIVSFMRNLMSGAFKDNNHLYKGVITGILRVSKESIFSGFNNLTVSTILGNEFIDTFGFTSEEVKGIINDFEILEKNEEVQKWYNGYKFGDITDIYNPWSVLNYARNHKNGFKPYWVNTSSDSLLKDQISGRDAQMIRDAINKLVEGNTITKVLNENFVFSDFEKNQDLFWTLLTFSGYLTVVRQKDRLNYELKIPNYEVKTLFQDIILNWICVEVRVKQNQLIETCEYLKNNEIDRFEEGFREIMGDTFSYFDTQNKPEYVYQAYVLGLLAVLGDDYIIKSNRESGSGRYDIMLIPHDKENYGIVIEIKQLPMVNNETEDDLRVRVTNKIKEAKQQIEDNKYYKELVANKIEKIIKLPIVFVGKEPYIVIPKSE